MAPLTLLLTSLPRYESVQRVVLSEAPQMARITANKAAKTANKQMWSDKENRSLYSLAKVDAIPLDFTELMVA